MAVLVFVAGWAFLQLQRVGATLCCTRGLLIALASLVAEPGL